MKLFSFLPPTKPIPVPSIRRCIKFTEAVDAFAHPFLDRVRDRVSDKAMEMRRQGFFGAAMLPMSELEYTGIMEKLERLDERFVPRRVGEQTAVQQPKQNRRRVCRLKSTIGRMTKQIAA